MAGIIAILATILDNQNIGASKLQFTNRALMGVTMKFYITVFITLFIVTISSTGNAAPPRPGPYVSAFLGTNVTRDTTISGIDTSPPVAIQFDDRASFDPGIYVGGTGGYDFGYMRLEGELAYRHARFDSITNSSGVRFRGVDGDLGTFSTMFNVFFDMHNRSRVTPYLGGGIGFATVHLSETTVNNGILYDESSDTVFAAQAGAGLDVAINSRYSLDFGYRYFITDKARLNGDFTSSDLRLESHNMLVGFKFKF